MSSEGADRVKMGFWGLWKHSSSHQKFCQTLLSVSSKLQFTVLDMLSVANMYKSQFIQNIAWDCHLHSFSCKNLQGFLEFLNVDPPCIVDTNFPPGRSCKNADSLWYLHLFYNIVWHWRPSDILLPIFSSVCFWHFTRHCFCSQEVLSRYQGSVCKFLEGFNTPRDTTILSS